MTFPRARLAVAASLFVAWLGYLLLLVVGSRHTIVLSRPQFLVANLWVLAEVKDDEEGTPARAVKILEVFLPKDSDLKGKSVEVANLADAGPQGYIGPGKYILPLDEPTPAYAYYSVPPVPFTIGSGFVPTFVDVRLYAPVGDAAEVARAAREIFGLSEADARAKMIVAEKNGSVVLARNVRHERLLEFNKRFPNIKALPQPNDIRIYPMTAETMEQLKEMLKARQP
jgi:hypothetical protein